MNSVLRPYSIIPQDVSNCYIVNNTNTNVTNGKLCVQEYDYYRSLNATKSVFSHSGNLVCQTQQPLIPKQLQSDTSTDYLFFAFIASLVLFAYILVRYWHYLTTLYESLVFRFIGDKLVNDVNVPMRKLLMLLDISLILFICFCTINTIHQFNLLPINHYKDIIYFALVLGGFVLYRIYFLIINRAIQAIVYNKNFVRRLQFDALLTYRLTGYTLLPFTFFINYNLTDFGKYLYFVVLAAFVIMMAYRFFKLLKLFLQNEVSFLYFILYLCTLEIMPILLVVKIV